MEKEIFSLAGNLTSAIKQSEYYKDYIKSKKYIDKNPELKNKISEFKKSHFEFQRKKANSEEITFDYERSMSREYYSLILDDDVKKFLDSERNLIEILIKVYNKITDDCRIDLDFNN